EQVDCQDDLERINIKKFRGDLAYKKQEFQKALQEYSSCLALVPSSNIAMRRDLKESQARCLAHLGKHEEAMRIAENLKNGATNTDHVTAVLNLQYTIYRLLEDIENVIGCLQKLISLHPFHPQTWNLLAETYLNLLQFPVPLSSGTKAHLWQSDGLIAGSCLRVSSQEVSIVCYQTQSLRKDGLLSCTIHTNDSFGPCVELSSVQRPVCALENSGPRPTMKRAPLGERRLKDTCVYACASFVRASPGQHRLTGDDLAVIVGVIYDSRGNRSSSEASGACRSPSPGMALLPFAFEESVFEDEEGGGASRAGGPLASPYSARCCEPEMIVPILTNLNKLGSNAVIDHDIEIKAGCSEWFCEQVDCQDDLERINIKKFRGDLAYKKQEFQVMGEDLVPEKLKGEAQEEVKCFSATAFPSILTVSTVEFERKWFQKLQGCFHHMDCPT
ncbi:PREDICTED: uncharacterized protein C8orf76 homolog, partial [Thamnophis sirtalis]|uniref:Uncharacterized protein C8orf76 homolog n=1 Tax=Thamnophis sirtalis TaxID=35019 RepID=A0A6I9XYK0_9SAUR